MNLDGFTWLLSAPGQALLAELAANQALAPAAILAYLTRLRKHYPADGAAAAVEVALLRREAAAKFRHAERLYFTREALEQATPHLVAEHRAARFRGCARVADLACSIGGDALPLAQVSPVLAVDRDPLRLALLRANAEALGLADRITPREADLATLDLADCDGLFFDPARRVDGRRLWHPEQYQPPLSTLKRWSGRIERRAAKVAPGIQDADLPPDCEAEFVSLDGDLREACLWWGPLRTAGRRATLLAGAGPPHTLIASPDTPRAPLAPPGRYLYEPDPAVIRAHAVAELAGLLGAAQIDPTIAYLTADALRPTPFARAWEIELALPFNLKALRRLLHERDIGRVTVKKRGSPITPEELTRQLRLRGSRHQILVLTQVAGAPTVLLCQPSAAP